jgi:hypothetical protein
MTELDHGPGWGPDQGPGRDSNHGPGWDAGHDPGQGPGWDAGHDPGQGPGYGPGPDRPPRADDPAGARHVGRRFPLPGGPGIWLGAAALVVALAAFVVVLVRVQPAHRTGRDQAGHRPSPADPGVAASQDPGAIGGPQPSGGPAQPGQSAAPPPQGGVTCPAATVTVTDAESLQSALTGASPGASIHLRDGVYQGKFVAGTPGTKDKPIFLCGGPGAILQGGGVSGGYGLHLSGASYWRVVGFTVRDAQKGVMADHVQGSVIQGLTVEHIGDEGIHLRNFSTDNLVIGNTVRDTGNRKDQFGEGVYVGSAKSNWGTVSGGKPDNSDRNVIKGNTITGTRAECVDIKEGTTGGTVTGNTFDGSAFSGSFADSWIDVKGNGWVIEGNTGRNSKADGFQTHEAADGWGTGNVFRNNTAEVNGPGYGFNLSPAKDNKVSCDNKVKGAAKGTANVPCG